MQLYERKWLQHLERMDINKNLLQALKYKEKWRRNIGRRKNRWKDHFHLGGSGTGTQRSYFTTVITNLIIVVIIIIIIIIIIT